LASCIKVKMEVLYCLLAKESIIVMVLAFRNIRLDVDVERYDSSFKILSYMSIAQAHESAFTKSSYRHHRDDGLLSETSHIEQKLKLLLLRGAVRSDASSTERVREPKLYPVHPI